MDTPLPKTITVNGAELSYVEQGSGFPVILVHGSLGDFRSWRFQLEPFSQHYRVIAYSRRYHYPNRWTGDGSDYSAALHAEDLAALIRALALDLAFVVGASYGAFTTLLLADRYPQLVRAFVLGEPPILPWLKDTPTGQPLYDAFMTGAWEPARQAFQQGNLEDGVRRFIDGVSAQGAFDRLPPPARTSMMDNAPEMQAETTAPNYFPPFTREVAWGINAPVLLVNGELSPRMFHVITDDLERCLPNNQRVMIPGASHAIQSGNPQAYNEAVLAFLAEH
jgi:non-heme chloroperoxidase